MTYRDTKQRVILPTPPKQYSQEDQANLRRELEKWFEQLNLTSPYIGLDGSGQVAIYGPNGFTEELQITNGYINILGGGLDVGGVQLIGARQPSIANVTTTSANTQSNASTDPVSAADYNTLVTNYNALRSTVLSLTSTLNTLLGELRPPPAGHGLIGA